MRCILIGVLGVAACALRIAGAFLPPSSVAARKTTTYLASTTTAESLSGTAAPDKASQSYNSVVVGGGPAGLLSAIALARKYPDRKIAVFDRLPAPPSPTDVAVWNQTDRFYLIGLGHRGQKALGRFDVWDDVEAVCSPVFGRKDWAPGASVDEGVERLATDKPTTTQVLPRDKLVGVLYKHIMENFPDQVELNYGYEADIFDFGDSSEQSVKLGVSKCVVADGSEMTPEPEAECEVDNYRVVNTDFLIGADGAARGLANEMESKDAERLAAINPAQRLFAKKTQFKVKRFVDDNQRVYKSIPVKVPSNWRFDLNYSARSRGNRMAFELLPADDQGTYCGILLIKPDDELAAPNSDPAKLRKFFDDEFPQFSSLIDDNTLSLAAEKSSSNLPGFRYAGPRIHQGDRTVLLGDAIHTVKPYYGLGANTALEDVSELCDCLDSAADLKSAVEMFSEKRAVEANALVTISRNMDRPGKLGLAAFLVPLILDGLFYRLAPRLFAPGMFSLFQKDGVTFKWMQRRKRIDRAVQLTIIGSTFYGMFQGFKASVSLVARRLGMDGRVVGAVTIAASVLLRSVKNSLKPKEA